MFRFIAIHNYATFGFQPVSKTATLTIRKRLSINLSNTPDVPSFRWKRQHATHCRALPTLITIEEYKKTARPKVVMTWAPHPRPLPQAVPNSFAEWMNATDYEFVITHPERL